MARRNPSAQSEIALWQPIQELLGPDGIGRCTGYAESTGQQCRNRINIYDNDVARNLFRDLGRLDPCDGIPRRKLVDIAWLTLCKSLHRDQAQVSDVVDEWEDLIFCHTQDIVNTQAPTIGISGSAVGSYQLDTGSGLLPSSRQDISQELDLSRLSISTPAATSNRQVLQPRSVTHGLSSGVREHLLGRTGASRFGTAASTDGEVDSASDEQRDVRDYNAGESDSHPTSGQTQKDPKARASHPHTPRRRPLDDCAVCLEPFHSTRTVLRIVHCRGQCGHNFHQECMTQWADYQQKTAEDSEHSVRGPAAVKCPHCRSTWDWEDAEANVL